MQAVVMGLLSLTQIFTEIRFMAGRWIELVHIDFSEGYYLNIL